MNRALPLALVLALVLIGAAQARHTETGLWKEGTPVVIMGQVTSKPHKVAGAVEKHFQIALGPSKSDIYTLHVSDAEMTGVNGEKLAASDLVDKIWVRAEGTIMNDPHRIKVAKLEVLGRDAESVRKTKFYRKGFERGYIDEVKP